jgi:cell surface protein SprA
VLRVGTIQDFDMFALDHDSDRHFFISIFRNKYDASLKTIRLLIVEFKYQLEIWVTNKQTRVNTTSNNLRNIIALQDLGKANYLGF